MRKYFNVIATLLVAAVFISACSSSSSKANAKVADSAIGEALFGKANAGDAFSKIIVKGEKAIALCMSDKGWEYFPDTKQKAPNLGIAYVDDNFANKEKREKYGYGMTTFYKADGSQDEEEIGKYYGFLTQSKNDDYVNSLSESERARYEEDLYGQRPTDFSTTSESEGGDSNSGSSDLDTGDTSNDNNQSSSGSEFDNQAYKDSCAGQVATKFFGDISDYEKLGQKISDLSEKFSKSKKLKTIAKDWKACLSSSLKKDKDSSLAKKIIAKLKTPTDMSEITQVLVPEDKNSPQDAMTIEDSDFAQPSYDKDELKKSQAFELRLAKLDYDCQVKEYFVPASNYARSMEEKFIKENKADLNKMQKNFTKV